MSGNCKKANDKNSKMHLKTTLLKVDFYQNDFILPLLLYRNKILFYFQVTIFLHSNTKFFESISYRNSGGIFTTYPAEWMIKKGDLIQISFFDIVFYAARMSCRSPGDVLYTTSTTSHPGAFCSS